MFKKPSSFVMKRQTPSVSRADTRWHAVTVVSNKPTCAAAQMLRAARFLSNEAPVLPLSDCSQPSACRCMYRHHNDRRAQTPRRRDELTGLRRVVAASEERRTSRTRRESD